MKIAIFDFCDTIVNFQTADEYVIYACKKLGIELWFNKLLQDESVNAEYEKEWKKKKKMILSQLEGVERESLIDAARDYYIERIIPELNNRIIEDIHFLNEEGYEVIIVSSGYSIYIDYFAEEYGVKEVIANDFFYKGSVFSGRIIGEDCYGEEKVRRIEQELLGREIISDSISYSDNISDIPILQFAKKGVVVSKATYREWPEKYGFEQIVLYPNDCK